VEECLDIFRHNDGGVYDHDGKKTILPKGTIASMNLWGFDKSFMKALESKFPKFLDSNTSDEIQKAEYMIPVIVNELLKQNIASVKVLKANEKWFGITYQQDMSIAKSFIRSLKEKGIYSEKLWDKF